MKRSSLAWYVAVACLGGSLCVGSVAQADSPTTVKVNNVAPTAIATQIQPAQPVTVTAAQTPVVNTAVSNNETLNDAVAQAALKEKQEYQA